MLLIYAYLIFLGFIQAQDPCRVNVVFSIDGSINEKNLGDSILYDQIYQIQNAYNSWTISPNDVRATLARPIGCTQGGSWALQNDLTSLGNTVQSVKRFLYTCFNNYTLFEYFNELNTQIINNPSDPSNYVFVIFTSTIDENDVNEAILLRENYIDPQGYGLVVVKVQLPTANNLNDLQTFGIYDLKDPKFVEDMTSSICTGQSIQTKSTVASRTTSSTARITTTTKPTTLPITTTTTSQTTTRPSTTQTTTRPTTTRRPFTTQPSCQVNCGYGLCCDYNNPYCCTEHCCPTDYPGCCGTEACCEFLEHICCNDGGCCPYGAICCGIIQTEGNIMTEACCASGTICCQDEYGNLGCCYDDKTKNIMPFLHTNQTVGKALVGKKKLKMIN